MLNIRLESSLADPLSSVDKRQVGTIHYQNQWQETSK